jgi:pyridoxamine 5'-phosphate oxidase
VNEALEKFRAWYETARRHAGIADASAMALATADACGQPAVRMVLLKDYGEDGFVFYTNLNSPKAHDLGGNPRAALCFHWAPLHRQVRIQGSVQPVTAEEADAYFASRPRLSQLGAWASAQSQTMPHRHALQTGVATSMLRFGLGPVPRPPHWSGYRVVPASVEFWTEQPFRQHERELFVREDGGWRKSYLYP